MQIARMDESGSVVLVVGDPDCAEDPCSLHGTCHCMCPCGMDAGQDCADCDED